MNRGERIALWHYRLRGYRIIDRNVRVAGNELDLIVRRGRTLLFVEVKQRSSDAFGGPLAAVTAEKRRRLRRAATAWLSRHHGETRGLEIGFEVAAVHGRRVERVATTLDDS